MMTKTTYYPRPKRIEKLSRNEQLNLLFDLINAFSLLKSPAESAFLLRDLITANEIKNLAKRLRIAKLLLAGKTVREINNELHTSFVTITKVRLWLEQGGEGFKNVISKLPNKYNLPKKLPRIPLEFQLPNAIISLAQTALATKQNNLLKHFEKDIETKKILDKNLREASKPLFINKNKKKLQ